MNTFPIFSDFWLFTVKIVDFRASGTCNHVVLTPVALLRHVFRRIWGGGGVFCPVSTDHTAGARTLLAPAAAERRLMHKRAWRPLVRLLSQPCSSSQVLFRLVRRFGFTRANKVGNGVNSDDLIKNSHFGVAHAQFFT